MSPSLLRWVPLGIIAALLLMFLWGLNRTGMGDTAVRSHWINKPLPDIVLPAATDGVSALDSRTLRDGKPRLYNVFASWCVPCQAEAPQLEELKRRGVMIEGIAVRDRPEDVAAFLARHGNPYAHIGSDARSEVQLALGSSGVPETFLVDGKGVIRAQIQGAITNEMIPDILRQLEQMQ